jgi:hypothetical protein
MIGFYSHEARHFGSFLYRKPDGTEVEVTSVFSSKERGERIYRWDDKVCVGEVTKFIRPVVPTPLENK